MYKVKVVLVGKTREPWLEEGIEEYQKRLTGTMTVEWVIVKDDEQLIKAIEKEGSVLCLDSEGVEFSSEEFSDFLFKELRERGSRLVFVMGGPKGLPEALKGSRQCLSLSAMTFTHQMTRLILMEQLYRAVQIQKGTEYHK